MSAKERVLTIRLMRHMTHQVQFARTLGIEVVMAGAQPRKRDKEQE